MNQVNTLGQKFIKSDELIYVGSLTKLKKHINASQSESFKIHWLNDNVLELYIRDVAVGLSLLRPSLRERWETSYHDEFRIQFVEKSNPS